MELHPKGFTGKAKPQPGRDVLATPVATLAFQARNFLEQVDKYRISWNIQDFYSDIGASMMAGLFALISAAMIAISLKQRQAALILWAAAIFFSAFMLWHHADTNLKINW